MKNYNVQSEIDMKETAMLANKQESDKSIINKKVGLRLTKASKILGVIMISLCVILSVLLTPIAGISAAISGFWLWVGIAFILSLMDYNDRNEVAERGAKSKNACPSELVGGK